MGSDRGRVGRRWLTHAKIDLPWASAFWKPPSEYPMASRLVSRQNFEVLLAEFVLSDLSVTLAASPPPDPSWRS